MNYMRIIFKKFKARMIVGCILAVIALLAVSVIVFINQASFGRTPRGERLERVMKSPNYRNGEFKNQQMCIRDSYFYSILQQNQNIH